MGTTFGEYRRQPDFGTTLAPEYDAWIISPISHHRDSDLVAESNWDAQLSALRETGAEGGEGDDGEDGGGRFDGIAEGDWLTLRFGHWAVGWVEHVITRPGSPAAAVVAGLVEKLESYPLLDDDDHGRREWEEYSRAWEDYGRKDFMRALRKEFGDRRTLDYLDDVASSEQLRELYEGLRPSGEYHTAEGSGVSLWIDHAAKDFTRQQYAAFVRTVRAAERAAAAEQAAFVAEIGKYL